MDLVFPPSSALYYLKTIIPSQFSKLCDDLTPGLDGQIYGISAADKLDQ